MEHYKIILGGGSSNKIILGGGSSNIVPMPIHIKEEVLSDSEEVHCRLCHKCFASPVALNNHARMDHIDAYDSGDPTVWTKDPDDAALKQKVKCSKREQQFLTQKRKEAILSSMKPTPITSLAGKNVSYIIIKSDDPLLEQKTKRLVKKDKELVKKVVVPKKEKSTQAITGPFECLEPSPLGADGSCHQIFFSCCEYSTHLRSEHARRRRTARCQVCERALPSRPDDPVAPYACETCGDGFHTADELQDHTTKLHVKKKPYECAVCHKRFTQQGGVVQHMRMHTGDRPFPCTFCPKAFTQKSGLDQHHRTHTKVKPYRCVICSKCFIQSVHLKQHMRTHTNVTPFQCGVCLKRFKQSSHLTYHLRNHNPATMTEEQREKYAELVGQLNDNADSMQEEIEVQEVDNQDYLVQEIDPEQVLAEQSIQDGEYEEAYATDG